MGKKAKKTTRNDKKRERNMAKNIGLSLHAKQRAFHGDKARKRWIFGGNRTGKTSAGAYEAVWLAVNGRGRSDGHHKRKPTEGWVVSLTQQVQRDVAQRKVLELLGGITTARQSGDVAEITYECVMMSGRSEYPERGVIDFILVHSPIGDSRIGFRNCEQGREKFQGVRLDWVWFDEEPEEEVFEECLMRTLDNGGYVWGTMTPLKGKTWVYDRVYMGGEFSIHQWSWEDNTFLKKREVAGMERSYSAEALESRKFGRFSEGGGLVYPEFSEKNIVKIGSILLQKEKWVYNGISIDPGYTNPTAVLWFGIDGDENIFVIDEYKESGRSVEQLASIIREKSRENGVRVENVFIDSAATAMSLGSPESVTRQFWDLGIPVNPEVDKNVFEGIQKVKGLFKSADDVRKLYICENCVELIKELRGYFWGDRNKPMKRNDHCVDALRYFCMVTHKVEPIGPIEQGFTRRKQNIYQKHKRRKLNEKYEDASCR